MLYRKIENAIIDHLKHDDKILIIEGAKQVDKTFIIREAIKKCLKM